MLEYDIRWEIGEESGMLRAVKLRKIGKYGHWRGEGTVSS